MRRSLRRSSGELRYMRPILPRMKTPPRERAAAIYPGSPGRAYNSAMSSVVSVNANVLGGTPVFAGTRVPIESLFDYLRHGRSIGYFLEQFPSVKLEQVNVL